MLISGWIRDKKILTDLVTATIESHKINKILLEQNGIFTPIQVRNLLEAKGKAKRVAVIGKKIYIVEK